MKKSLLILAVCCCFSISYSRNTNSNDIPEVLENAISKKFPGAEDIQWSKQDNIFVVRFEMGRNDYKAIVDERGKINIYKKSISISELPAAVMDKIKKSFADKKIKNVEQVTKNGQNHYQMIVDSKTFFAKMVYTADGEPNNINYWD